MEPQSTLVGPQRRVELHAKGIVDLAFALVVLPSDAELDDAFGDGGDLEGFAVGGVFFEEGGVFEGGGEFFVGLFEFGFG